MLFRSRTHPSQADLNAHVDGALGGSARTHLEAHVATCQACQASLGELRDLKASLATLSNEVAPRSFAVREADVAPAISARMASRGAPVFLSGLATVAMVTFVTLVAVDASNTPSDNSGPVGGLEMREESDDGAMTDSLAPEPNSAGDMEAVAGSDPPAETPSDVQALDDAQTGDDDGTDQFLAAEVATAGLALIAGGGAVFYWRRRV